MLARAADVAAQADMRLGLDRGLGVVSEGDDQTRSRGVLRVLRSGAMAGLASGLRPGVCATRAERRQVQAVRSLDVFQRVTGGAALRADRIRVRRQRILRNRCPIERRGVAVVERVRAHVAMHRSAGIHVGGGQHACDVTFGQGSGRLMGGRLASVRAVTLLCMQTGRPQQHAANCGHHRQQRRQRQCQDTRRSTSRLPVQDTFARCRHPAGPHASPMVCFMPDREAHARDAVESLVKLGAS